MASTVGSLMTREEGKVGVEGKYYWNGPSGL